MAIRAHAWIACTAQAPSSAWQSILSAEHLYTPILGRRAMECKLHSCSVRCLANGKDSLRATAGCMRPGPLLLPVCIGRDPVVYRRSILLQSERAQLPQWQVTFSCLEVVALHGRLPWQLEQLTAHNTSQLRCRLHQSPSWPCTGQACSLAWRNLRGSAWTHLQSTQCATAAHTCHAVRVCVCERECMCVRARARRDAWILVCGNQLHAGGWARHAWCCARVQKGRGEGTSRAVR